MEIRQSVMTPHSARLIRDPVSVAPNNEILMKPQTQIRLASSESRSLRPFRGGSNKACPVNSNIFQPRARLFSAYCGLNAAFMFEILSTKFLRIIRSHGASFQAGCSYRVKQAC